MQNNETSSPETRWVTENFLESSLKIIVTSGLIGRSIRLRMRLREVIARYLNVNLTSQSGLAVEIRCLEDQTIIQAIINRNQVRGEKQYPHMPWSALMRSELAEEIRRFGRVAVILSGLLWSAVVGMLAGLCSLLLMQFVPSVWFPVIFLTALLLCGVTFTIRILTFHPLRTVEP